MILINKFAIGTPPFNSNDFNLIKNKIISVLDLRNEYDLNKIDYEDYMDKLKDFNYCNTPLPDHNSGRFAIAEEINQALDQLDQFLAKGPVFMHCHASIERSPLISMAYLHLYEGLTLIQAYDHVNQQNTKTNVNLIQLKNIGLTK